LTNKNQLTKINTLIVLFKIYKNQGDSMSNSNIFPCAKRLNKFFSSAELEYLTNHVGLIKGVDKMNRPNFKKWCEQIKEKSKRISELKPSINRLKHLPRIINCQLIEDLEKIQAAVVDEEIDYVDLQISEAELTEITANIESMVLELYCQRQNDGCRLSAEEKKCIDEAMRDDVLFPNPVKLSLNDKDGLETIRKTLAFSSVEEKSIPPTSSISLNTNFMSLSNLYY
jgi:hypothetical protein